MTKTSEGDLAVGSEVKTSTGEEFYVIDVKDNKAILLAKNNLKADGTAQDTTGAVNPCAFSSTEYWSSETSYPADLNDTAKYPIPEGATSIVKIAKAYGTSLGATGRLMTKSEADALKSTNSDILYGINGKSSSEYLMYWLSPAYYSNYVWVVYGNSSLSYLNYDHAYLCGVRPVIEISASQIS